MYCFCYSVDDNVNSTNHPNCHKVCKSNDKSDTESSDSASEDIDPNKNNEFGKTQHKFSKVKLL